ncbi:class I SAM-dependent methyltransferase [Aquabacter sp. L1I39]|uniref:class I SAM-dependent methyltransferase n=1 Tax=Aquabacter sp. L1I39 TaxID=2820278 RepID=UPI001ADC8F5E|nr:class I SAM-dependent methyltransferase [Aquabacter sp. L1I39]QTL03037.1 class I SAM-dependent methyltransferase [Aquabacter sp. L1I39]
MGEIFDRPAPSEELEWTGERLTSAVSGQIEIEHLHRYFFARAFCRGVDVLDVAAGEGYGSSLLAQVARSVVGVEVDPAAAAHAARAYGKANLSYVNGDARALPLPDACVDVVVSFETLEHFFEHDLFLAEVKRVLRPGGTFIISSPDRDVYSPLGSGANPYHVNELTRQEFERLLARHFRNSAMLLQRPMLGSVLFPDGPARGVLSFERRGEDHYEACEGLPRAPYNLVVASDADVALPQASVFFESSAIGEILAQVDAHKAGEAALAQRSGAMRAQMQAAEDGTRAAFARARRAEDALDQMARTCRAELDALAAGLRDELDSLSLTLDRHAALAAGRVGDPGDPERLLATLRENLREADDLVRRQVGRVGGFVEGLSAAFAVSRVAREDFHLPTAAAGGGTADGQGAAPAGAGAMVGDVAASAGAGGGHAPASPDQAELALLRDTVSALQTQIATLQSQKEAMGLSYRIQSSMVQKLRNAEGDGKQTCVEDDVYAGALVSARRENEELRSELEDWKGLFEHTRGSVESALRVSGVRLMPKAARSWLRRKIYGPRWIR